VDRPLPWLRYLDATEIADETVDFDGLKVRNDSGEQLGEVDGFVVDADTGRPYYVVVDSGGWFSSKDFLIPVGHVRLDADRDALVADLTQERIKGFPGFDKNRFEQLSDDDIRRMNDEISTVCCVGATSYSADEPVSASWNQPHYRFPDWWRGGQGTAERIAPAASAAEYRPARAAADEQDGREGDRREAVTARETNDVSPHFDGRAQPGDVIGLETGGERTYIGDTSEDENERRRSAEEADRKNRGE
jgi:hypothetical protein